MLLFVASLLVLYAVLTHACLLPLSALSPAVLRLHRRQWQAALLLVSRQLDRHERVLHPFPAFQRDQP